MKILYIVDRNSIYSDEEQKILLKLKDEHQLKPIYIKRCTKSRYLCKKERIDKLNRDLSRLSKNSHIVFFNFMHLGKSYEEISSVLFENSKCLFFHIYPTSMEDLPFCKELIIKDNYKICSIKHYDFHQISKEYIKKQSILYGLKCSKKKSQGRTKGSVNKQSDYDPYKEKILEALKKQMSFSSILIYIGFGSKSGLKYYIKHRL